MLRQLCLKRKVSASRKRLGGLKQSKTYVEDVSGSSVEYLNGGQSGMSALKYPERSADASEKDKTKFPCS